MKKLICLLPVLCGCSNTIVPDEYDLKLSHWIGEPSWALFQQWGEPDEQYAIDFDTYVAIYNRTSSQPMQNRRYIYEASLSPEALKIGPEYGTSQINPMYYCQTIFTIKKTIIVDYSFNGDNCI